MRNIFLALSVFISTTTQITQNFTGNKFNWKCCELGIEKMTSKILFIYFPAFVIDAIRQLSGVTMLINYCSFCAIVKRSSENVLIHI